MSTPIERFLRRFPEARTQGDGWYSARCPAHDDRHASLNFREADDGHVWIVCHAKCPQGSILAALGMETREIYPEAPGPRQNGRKFTPYDYKDANGKVRYQNVRVEVEGKTKDFFVRRPDGMGGWVRGRGREKALLYELPGVVKAIASGDPVWLVEGEKDVHTLQRLGLSATTSGGANTWRPEFAEYLKGAQVIAVPDNDDPGRSYIDSAVSCLRGVAESVVVVSLPVEQKGGDVSDWVAAGGTKEELLALAEAAKAKRAAQPESKPFPDRFPMTGPGNAERLEARFGDGLRFCHTSRRWLIWDGRRWAPDVVSEVMDLARRTVRDLEANLPAGADWDQRKTIAQHVKRYDTDSEYNALLRQAATMGRIRATAEQFDTDPYLLTCLNGTLDLRSGELRPHDPDDMITKLAPVEYDPDAECPQWLAFLAEVMDGREALVTFLQRAIGYSLTGDTRERVVFILHGSGRNGKSTLLDAMRYVTGDYGTRTPTETVLAKRDASIPNDIARLAGCRFVTASESDQGSDLAEATVKDMTGGEPITARFLHREWFEFKPQFKLWLGTNHVPTVKGTDEAIWDRIRLVPFEVRIPEDRIDYDLARKLRAEASGILAWAMRGCADWLREGLTHPAEVKRATKRYRADMDSLMEFFEQNCAIGKGTFAQARPLYQRYCKWCALNEVEPEPEKAFSGRIAERGFVKERTKGGMRWFGFSLLPDDSDDQDPGCRVQGVKGSGVIPELEMPLGGVCLKPFTPYTLHQPQKNRETEESALVEGYEPGSLG